MSNRKVLPHAHTSQLEFNAALETPHRSSEPFRLKMQNSEIIMGIIEAVIQRHGPSQIFHNHGLWFPQVAQHDSVFIEHARRRASSMYGAIQIPTSSRKVFHANCKLTEREQDIRV